MNYLTIQEAMKLTGKSESTFRNLARKLKASKSKDIKLEKLKTGHEKILFKESFINSYFDTSSNTSSNSYQSQQESTSNEELIEFLKSQIIVKDRQIETHLQTIQQQNVLILNAQEQVKLIEAPKKKRWWQRK